MDRDDWANWVLLIVVIIGMVNFFAQFIPGLNYKPDPIITAAFLGISGTVIGAKGLSHLSNGRKGSDDSDRRRVD